MNHMPDYTEDSLLAWLGETALEQGRACVQDGAILSPRRHQNTLKALCHSSSGHPYRVVVTIGANGIEHAACTAPGGKDAHGKYLAALLLTWLEDRDSFLEVESVDTILERSTKEDVIKLVHMMISRAPELELLLEVPISRNYEATPTATAEMIRRRMSDALADTGFEKDAMHIATDIHQLVTLGERYLLAQQWLNAAMVFQSILQEILDNRKILQGDEEPVFATIVDRCIAGLEACLPEITHPEKHEDILQTVFDVYALNVILGDIELGKAAPDVLVRQATLAEKQCITAWVEAARTMGSAESAQRREQTYDTFLSRLEQELARQR